MVEKIEWNCDYKNIQRRDCKKLHTLLNILTHILRLQQSKIVCMYKCPEFCVLEVEQNS